MGVEIERKFLVTGEFKHLAIKSSNIIQGYLSESHGNIVRIRIQDNTGILTIKGKPQDNNIKRYEWEKEISINEAKELIDLCKDEIIHKTRYVVPEETGLSYEVDVFHDNNSGLILAEIELPDENTKFNIPDWIGREVTNDIRYFNSSLRQTPFSTWKT